MARGLTKKRKGFVKDYVETGIGSLAVKRNYNVANDKTATVMASELLDDKKVQEAINAYAEQIPDDLLLEKHLALLSKMNGDEIDAIAVKYGLDMAYKIKGTYAPEKKAVVNLNLDESREKSKQAISRYLGDIG